MPRPAESLMLVVIAYDTPCDRRRRRIARLADDYGCRVQKSVFQGWLSHSMRARLIAHLREIVDEDEDSVFVLPACGHCQGMVTTLGLARFDPLPPFWIL